MLDFSEASKDLDNPARAIAVLATAEQYYPSEGPIHWRLSRLYRQTGNTALANKELKLFRASPQ
jgi:hypothetical protein